MQTTNLFKLVICFFLGHRKVEGHFTDGVEYYEAQCPRCKAYYGHPKKELNYIK